MVTYKAITEASETSVNTFIAEIEAEPENVKFYRRNALYGEDEYTIEPGQGKIIALYEKWSLEPAERIAGRAQARTVIKPETYIQGETMPFKTWVWLKRETAYLYGMGPKTWEWVKKCSALKKLEGLERWRG